MTETRLSLVDESVSSAAWPRTKLRGLLDRVRDTGCPDRPLLSANLPVGVVLRGENDGRMSPSLDLTGYLRVQPGDLVMNPLGKPHGSLGVSPYAGITSPAYFVARPRPGVVHPRFLHHLLRSRLYISEYERVGKWMPPSQFNLSWRQLMNIPVYLPSMREQHAIADFLDQETARIDDLVAKKRRLIGLLEEKRSSLIAQTVTKGLDPTVPMKDSGVPWLGQVPAHWMILPLRRFRHELQTGPFGSQLHASDYVEGMTPILNATHLANGAIEPDQRVTADASTIDRLQVHILRQGDLIFGRRGEAARVALITDREAGWLCGTGSIRLRLADGRLLPDYLTRYMSSAPVGGFFEATGGRATMLNLNEDMLRSTPVICPPVREQTLICATLIATERDTRAAASAITRQLGLLAEYRHALITAAVTGEIDVSKVAPDPEEAVA